MSGGWRRTKSRIWTGLTGVAVLVAVLPLLMILGTLVLKGAGSLSLDFFTRLPAPAGEVGGGVVHALTGTLIIVGMACLIGLPLGILGGIYCAEFASSRLALTTRFVCDVLNGTPSIVVGVFVWTWIVATQKHFSALAGSIALAILMVPMVTRTTEEMIKLVPNSLREAALALGYPRWRTSLQIIVRREMERDLRQALDRDQLVVHYQPLMDLGRRAEVGFEALLRWHHPQKGMISPADFVPIERIAPEQKRLVD